MVGGALLGGCGSATGSPTGLAALCPPRATPVLAGVVGARTSAVRVWRTQDYAQLRYCHYLVRGSGGRPAVRVLVTVDTGPQALWRLNRTEVEFSQAFATPGAKADPNAPVHIDRLGLDADWLPGQQEVMASDGVRLITVATVWPGAATARRRALAEALTRPFLGPARAPHQTSL